MSQDLSSIVVAFKVQSGLNVPAIGAGATGLELLPSQGFQSQIAQIATELLSSTRMAGRGRQGSEFFNWAGETELQVGVQTAALEAVLGGTWSVPLPLDNTTLTSCAITGTGTTITFVLGNLITSGVRAGMTATLTGMTNTLNNGRAFPILNISANGRILTIPSGILVDETADTTFTITVAAALSTATPYTARTFTFEHYLADIDRSLLGTNFRFNGINFSMNADQMVTVGLACGGTNVQMLSTALSPTFTNPVFAQGESLVLLDGGIYFNGVRRANLASFSFGLQAPISGLPLLSTKQSADAFLGQFVMDGQFTGIIADGVDYDAFRAEDQVSIYLHCAERNAANPFAAKYVGIYLPNMSFGGWDMPAGGEGAAIQTVPMNGGRDKRGVALGFASTSMLISTSN